MRNFSYLLLIVSCLLFLSFQMADSSIHIKFTEKGSKVKIDDFGNIYVINSNEIIKFNSAGIFQKTFSTKRYGTIDFVDVTNPLKILIYYRDFQQLLFLDNQLTQSSTMISLETIGYEQANLVCSSANNSFWLYNKQNNELLRFNAESEILVRTGNLKSLLQIDIKPNFIQEHNNYLYLNCPNEGILIFDIYGTYYKTIALKKLKEFKVVNGDIFYFENNTLKQYQQQSFNIIEKRFTDTLIKTVYLQNNWFYKLYSDSLIVETL